MRAFQEEVNARVRAADARRTDLKRELDGVERKIAGIFKAIEDGTYSPALKERLAAHEKRKAEIAALLAGSADRQVVHLHPNLSEIYRRKVAELEAELNNDAVKAEASEILRTLIDKIVLQPAADAPDGLNAELHGDLAAILSLCGEGTRKQNLSGAGAPESQLSVVAGERNQRYLHPFWSRIPVIFPAPTHGGNTGSNPPSAPPPSTPRRPR
jgi:hypothetical protein